MVQEGTGPFRCPRCGAVTSGNKEYCNECGQWLYIECPGCGKTWRYMYSYAFCPDCGTKVGEAVQAGPQRTLSR